MGNSDSTVTCEGAELQPTNTWWGRDHRASGRSYRKPSQPIRSQSRTTKHQNLDLNPDFGPDFPGNIFGNSWSNSQDNFDRNHGISSIKNGSLSSEENLEKCDINLSSSCQDSGFGESFQVPSPVWSPSPGSSPDLDLDPDFKDLVRTGAEAQKKDVFRTRIRKWSDWTGSLRIKKRRVQDPDLGSIWSFNPLQNQDKSGLNQDQPKSDLDHFRICQNFSQDLESGSILGSTSSDPDSVDQEDQGLSSGPGLNQDQGLDRAVVRRAGWIRVKPLIRLHKDQVQLVPRRKWKQYWAKLRGCWLQFFKSPGQDQDLDQDPDQDLDRDVSPVLELRVWDSLVQPVPEHPTKEHVFCLSNAAGRVYLLQASSQSDLEAWVTSVHSVAAATACRQGSHHGDTLHFLQERVHFLSQEVEAELRVKKMAALQLRLLPEPEARRSVQSQIGRWEQSVESLSLDLFRFKSYLSSLQGLELPNAQNPLTAASRASKCTLGKLGLFNVSTLHALVCSRDQATLRRHSRALIGQTRERRALIGRSIRRRRSFKPSMETTEKQNDEDQTDQEQEEKPEELSLQLSRPTSHLDYGFAVIGRVDTKGRSHIYISQVDPNGLSANQGLCVGDQVVSVNGASVSRLDLDLIPSVFSHRTLLLSLRRRRPSHDPAPANQERASPSHDPAPANQERASPSHDLRDTDPWTPRSDNPPTMSSRQSSDRISSLYQIFPECRVADPDVPRNPYDMEGAEPRAPSPSHTGHSPAHSSCSSSHLSACQRIRKVVEELLETEKSYVKDLSLLFELYLTPLQQQNFLSKHEMEALFGSLPAMLHFQKVFLQTLEEKIQSPDLHRLETPEELKMLLFSLGGSFLYYADHFKLYSGFCSNHLKVQKVLHRAKTDVAFKHFLEARNPSSQHSASLESFLIKPVQRVLKYPLLLRELVSLTEEQTPEHAHLTEALRSMETVASHINEMQKIYEEFGSVFERLSAENSSAPCGQVAELSMGDLLLHSSVFWLNPFPTLGRLRKDPELSLFVFKQAVILVYKDPKVKKRLVSRSDLDPFRFRWFIPASAAHIRNHHGTEFGLVHLRSESGGRLETVFQLSSRDPESRSVVLETLRSVLRVPPLSHAPFIHDDQTDQLEAQLQRLHFGDQSERREEDEGRVLRQWRRSLVELGGLMDKEFSVQSLTSIINEDCFYGSLRRHARPGLDLD